VPRTVRFVGADRPTAAGTPTEAPVSTSRLSRGASVGTAASRSARQGDDQSDSVVGIND
jgi:hypothetical protein